MWKVVCLLEFLVFFLVCCHNQTIDNETLDEVLRLLQEIGHNNATDEGNSTEKLADLNESIHKLNNKLSNLIPDNGTLSLHTVRENNIEITKTGNNTQEDFHTTAQVRNLTEMALNKTDTPVTFIRVDLPRGPGNNSLVVQVPISVNIKDIQDRIGRKDFKDKSKEDNIEQKTISDEDLITDFLRKLRLKYHIPDSQVESKKHFGKKQNNKENYLGNNIAEILNKLDQVLRLVSVLDRTETQKLTDETISKHYPGPEPEIPSKVWLAENSKENFKAYDNEEDVNVESNTNTYVNSNYKWTKEVLEQAKQYSDEQIAKAMKNKIKKLKKQQRIQRLFRRPGRLIISDFLDSSDCRK